MKKKIINLRINIKKKNQKISQETREKIIK